jgi:hypothetical protein
MAWARSLVNIASDYPSNMASLWPPPSISSTSHQWHGVGHKVLHYVAEENLPVWLVDAGVGSQPQAMPLSQVLLSTKNLSPELRKVLVKLQIAISYISDDLYQLVQDVDSTSRRCITPNTLRPLIQVGLPYLLLVSITSGLNQFSECFERFNCLSSVRKKSYSLIPRFRW